MGITTSWLIIWIIPLLVHSCFSVFFFVFPIHYLPTHHQEERCLQNCYIRKDKVFFQILNLVLLLHFLFVCFNIKTKLSEQNYKLFFCCVAILQTKLWTYYDELFNVYVWIFLLILLNMYKSITNSYTFSHCVVGNTSTFLCLLLFCLLYRNV